jgi:hypothetical protein
MIGNRNLMKWFGPGAALAAGDHVSRHVLQFPDRTAENSQAGTRSHHVGVMFR